MGKTIEPASASSRVTDMNVAGNGQKRDGEREGNFHSADLCEHWGEAQ